MTSTKYFKNRVILKYASVIKEYFTLINQSDTLKNIVNTNQSIYIGLTAIHRVFEYILLKTNNIDNAYYHSQKCYYYYLEYMEQINKTDLAQNLNHIDAVLFVFKKTIFDIYESESNSTSNIMTLNNENITINEVDLRNLLGTIHHFTRILFFWENTKINIENRINICNKYLQRYLSKIDSLDMTKSYLEIIQQKIDMDYFKYEDLLNELLIKIEKTRKMNVLSETDKNDLFLYKFYVEEHIFKEKFNEGNKELVNWLFV